MSELIRLLNDLGQDASLADAWARDPDEVLAGYKLDDAVIKALKAGDVEAIKRASGMDNVRLTNSTIKAY